MIDNKNIEDLFQQNFASYKVSPSQNVWTSLQAKLGHARFLNFNAHHFNVYYLSVAIIGLSVAASVFFFDSDTQLSAQWMENNPVAVDYTSKEITEENTLVEKKELQETTVQENTEKTIEAIDSNRLLANTIINRAEQVEFRGEIQTSKPMFVDLLKTLPVASFEMSVCEGCAPLTVDFENKSLAASSFIWDLGEKDESNLLNPQKTYEIAGEYIVTLRAIGIGGIMYQQKQVIRVHATPKASAYVENENELFTNQPIEFKNNSLHADYYQWNFGDNQITHEKSPTHNYSNGGIYDIMLSVWTENNCVDSILLPSLLVKESKNAIILPTAFSPNTEGSVGGQYSLSDRNNDVFYPLSSGVDQYNLRIFNGAGMLVFESNDLNIGWDGYYNNRLVNQGVYIWRIAGEYSNGEKFNQTGDVTVIY